MKAKYIKIFRGLIFFMVFFLQINSTVLADNSNKTIIVVTDKLDFSSIEKLNFDKEISIGLMNTRTSNVFVNSYESYFMTMATGRRVELEAGLFKGVENYNNRLAIKGYKDIIAALDKTYNNFSKEIEFLSDLLIDNGLSFGYIGNDPSSLLAADKEGIIQYGYTKVVYELNWLVNKTEEILTQADVLVISFNIDDNKDRLELLEGYINKFNKYNIMVFPKKVSGDIEDIRNKTLVPILYNKPNKTFGILTSDSTKREGLITNMDIFNEVASIYNIETNTSTGHEIYPVGRFSNKNVLIEKNKDNLDKTLNLVLVKYIFHGIVICTQLYIFFDIYRNKQNLSNRLQKYLLYMNRIIIYIFLSLLLGVFYPTRNFIIYCLSLLLLGQVIILFIEKRKINYYELFPIMTNILLIVAVYLKPELIYHTFFGFNNIITGGRFYGLNNETMAILLTTSIITFFWIKDRLKSKASTFIVLILYFSIVILALSDKYAANFGGFLSTIAVLVMLMYITLFGYKIDKKSIIKLACLGLVTFVLGLNVELNNGPNGHIMDFYLRIKTLGIYELVDMVLKKAKQLLLITISPPWSIIFLGQLCFIRKFALNNKKIIEKAKNICPHIEAELLIIFIGSLLVFILNDTGVVAFVYMNTFLIRKLIYLKIEYEYKGRH